MDALNYNLPDPEPILSFIIPGREEPLQLGLWEIEVLLEEAGEQAETDRKQWVELVRVAINTAYKVDLTLGQTAALIETVQREWGNYKKKDTLMPDSPSGTDLTPSDLPGGSDES